MEVSARQAQLRLALVTSLGHSLRPCSKNFEADHRQILCLIELTRYLKLNLSKFVMVAVIAYTTSVTFIIHSVGFILIPKK